MPENEAIGSVHGVHLGPFPIDSVQPIDCIRAMAELPDRCVDVAIADPPYNASKGGEWAWDSSVELPGFGGSWCKVRESWDAMDLPDYVQFTRAWLTELRRVDKPTGSLWIHGTYHNIGIINFLLQTLGVEILNEVIWYKRNSFPNLAGRRLTASHESILWAHTGKTRDYFFDYEASKGLPCPEDALRAPGKQMRTVWDIPNNKERGELEHGKHPTQKPLRLVTRMLRLSAPPGAICLVPFAGSGTECLAAKRLGMHYLGFEVDPAYVELATRRLDADGAQLPLPVGRVLEPGERTRETPTKRPARNTARVAQVVGREPSVPSLLKWTGSKRGQARRIADLVPTHDRYVEPFLGGGALLYRLARPGSIAGDLYRPLVDLWRLVQTTPHALADDYRTQWGRLQTSKPDYFYEARTRFNASPNPLDLNFLMRTCVNGIVRFNEDGAFNNSFHLSRPGMHPDRFSSIVEQWNRRIQGVSFRHGDYAETLSDVRQGDVVYVDPPYAGSRHRYVADLDVERFLAELERLNVRGVKWLLSFDGSRGGEELGGEIPKGLYVRRVRLAAGHSPVAKVLNGPLQAVEESLYLNF